MATTTNFGWETPDDTDLVKDGAAAIRTALNGVDTSFVDLKGGTSGQILSKASNTDLDYTWIDNQVGDITGVTAGTGISGGGTSGTVTVTNSMATAIDAKGDLIGGTGADAFARLAVGTDGQVLTADSAETTGLKWATPSASGQTLISTTTLSGSSTTISPTLTSYKHVLMVLKMVQASGTTTLRMRLNGDTGANYNTNIVQSSGTIANGRSSINATSFLVDDISTGSTVRATLNGAINLYRVNDTNEIVADWTTRNDDGVDYGTARAGAIYDASAAVTSITFLLDSGTFSAGTVYLYGVN